MRRLLASLLASAAAAAPGGGRAAATNPAVGDVIFAAELLVAPPSSGLPAPAPSSPQPEAARTTASPAFRTTAAPAFRTTAAPASAFPPPRVRAAVAEPTAEQRWLEKHWPGYLNGVNFGGLFVIEDWMFWRHQPPFDEATLHLPQKSYDQHAWSEALLAAGKQRAFDIFECHMQRFIGDEELDALAKFGINAVRIPVGYWLFDEERLYPGDRWVANVSGTPPYGVNPDGYVTPGTLPLSDLVVKLHNRNMKVIIDMHANPGCSSGHQSHAGILCEAKAPNLWAGEAHDGISGSSAGNYSVQRADDGKSWEDVAWRIALKRVVPWIKFIDGIAPGTIIGYEMVNEPDSPPKPAFDASKERLRGMTLDLGKEVVAALGSLASQVQVAMSSGVANGNHYSAKQMAEDYQKPDYVDLKRSYVSDLHHYFNWQGCIRDGHFIVQCACESNLPGAGLERGAGDAPWAAFEKAGIFNKGWRFFVGEWSAALGTSLKCHGGMPAPDTVRALWEAQKWGFFSQYLQYKGKAAGGRSAFLGDFYWSVRAGHNWNPDPDVCHGPSSGAHYLDVDTWDWSFLRLMKLGLVRPLSQLGLTQDNLYAKKGSVCSGTFRAECTQLGPAPPALPPVAEPAGHAPPLPEHFWEPPAGTGIIVEFPSAGRLPLLRSRTALLSWGFCGLVALAAAVALAACLVSWRARRLGTQGRWDRQGDPLE